jgi:DNA anti-recombination protein RmuC
MTMPDDPSTRPAERFGGPETSNIPSTAGARTQIRDVKDQVLDEAKNSLRQARDSATSSLTQSRHQASERIGGIAAAIRRTSDHLRAQNEPRVADVTETLAEQAERLSSYVRDRDFRGFQTDLQNLARRRPGVAIGAAVAVGVLAARFFKSSRRPGTLGVGGAR